VTLVNFVLHWFFLAILDRVSSRQGSARLVFVCFNGQEINFCFLDVFFLMYNVTPPIKRCVLAHALYAQLERHISQQSCRTHVFLESDSCCYLTIVFKITLIALSRAHKSVHEFFGSVSVCRLQPAYGYHTTTAKPQRNTNTHRTTAIQPLK